MKRFLSDRNDTFDRDGLVLPLISISSCKISVIETWITINRQHVLSLPKVHKSFVVTKHHKSNMILQRLLDILIYKNRVNNNDYSDDDEDREVELNNILNGELDEEIKCNITTHDDFWGAFGYPLLENAVEADLTTLAQILLRHAKVCVLLEHGEDKLVKYTNNNQTCLHIACRNENTSLVTILLEYDTDPNFICPQGCPPLIPATINHRIEVMKLLLANGADANWNIPNHRWGPALICACVHGYHDALQLLLDYGADINATNSNRDTALITVVRCLPGKISLTQLLLERDADPSIANIDGLTALHYTDEDSLIAQMLINAQLEPILK